MIKRREFLATIVVVPGVCIAHAEERRCRLCGVLIADNEKYYQVKGNKEVFCVRCYFQAPRCRLCKLPARAEELDPETGACPDCLAKLPRCRSCGKAIAGSAYQYRFARGVFCPECRKSRPACHLCGVPVGDDGWKYPDGRTICGECAERIVIDVDQIKRIMRDAHQLVVSRAGLEVKRPYTVIVEKLSDSGHDSGQAPIYGSELGVYRLSGDRSEIFLLFGLPPELLYETAAHEYAHAWQAENGLFGLPPDLLEGFAQWVAADVLRAKGYSLALEKLEARTDFPYGVGYRRLRAMQQHKVLELMFQKR